MGEWKICCRGIMLALGLLLAPSILRAGDILLPVLQVGSHTYSNVTVTSKTPRYIVIMHADGLTSIKLKELSSDTLKALGYKVEESPPEAANQALLARKFGIDPRVKEMSDKAAEDVKDRLQRIESNLRGLEPKVLIAVLGCVGLVYLFTCYCYMLICKKTGREPGVLVWFPILQAFPLLRAAGMSLWWFLLWFVPIINIGVTILWCVRICQARGKSSWLALPLLFPVTSIFAFLYLAFADGLDEEAPAKITFN